MEHINFHGKEKDESMPGKQFKTKRGIKRYLCFGAMLLVCICILFIVVLASKNSALKDQLERINEELSITKEILAEYDNNEDKDENEAPIITSSTIVEQLNGLSELVTQEYTYHNADRRESSETWIFGWTRPFSSNSILITYDGTIKAGVDFSKIEINVTEATKTIIIKIPESTITDNNIPQDSIEVLEVKNGLFNEVTFDNYNDFVSEQKVVMEQKAIEQGLLEKANVEAKALIENFISVIPGIENYHVVILGYK